jgi:hypothetical protein
MQGYGSPLAQKVALLSDPLGRMKKIGFDD